MSNLYPNIPNRKNKTINRKCEDVYTPSAPKLEKEEKEIYDVMNIFWKWVKYIKKEYYTKEEKIIIPSLFDEATTNEPDKETIFKQLDRMATKNNYLVSCLLLGWCYEYGYGCSKNKNKAFELYKANIFLDNNNKNLRGLYYYRLAKLTDKEIEAKELLQYAYFNEFKKVNYDLYLLENDLDIKMVYLEQASYDGNKLAIIRLIDVYKKKHNDKEMYFWIEKLAEKNDPKALFDLGYKYFNGIAGPIDYSKSKNYFIKAYNRSFYDYTCRHHIPISIENTCKEKEENQGKAAYYLGIIYFKYQKYIKDTKSESYLKAYDYFTKSINKHCNIKANLELGNMFYEKKLSHMNMGNQKKYALFYWNNYFVEMHKNNIDDCRKDENNFNKKFLEKHKNITKKIAKIYNSSTHIRINFGNKIYKLTKLLDLRPKKIEY